MVRGDLLYWSRSHSEVTDEGGIDLNGRGSRQAGEEPTAVGKASASGHGLESARGMFSGDDDRQRRLPLRAVPPYGQADPRALFGVFRCLGKVVRDIHRCRVDGVLRKRIL